MEIKQEMGGAEEMKEGKRVLESTPKVSCLAPKDGCEKPPPSSWIGVREKTGVTSTHNPVLSISHRQEVLGGKRKIIGVLTVGEAQISGIFRCVTANLWGKDELDFPFFVTDVNGDLVTSLEGEAREGGDLRLLCVANRHLYSDLSWSKVTNQSAGGGGTLLPDGELAEGPFSHTLHLQLKNVTMQDSGTYRCSAKHLLTGEHALLDTTVAVTVLQAPVLLRSLSDHTVNVSNSITLQCPAKGVPKPQVTWYKNHRQLQQESGIMLFPLEGTLHIDRITVEDQGLYTCEVTNQRGSVESSAHIWVESKEGNRLPVSFPTDGLGCMCTFPCLAPSIEMLQDLQELLKLQSQAQYLKLLHLEPILFPIDSSESLALEIPTLACTCAVAMLFWLFLTLLIRKLKQPISATGKTECLPVTLCPGEGLPVKHCNRLKYEPGRWEFPRERLKLEKLLGRGAFGRVFQASAFGIGNSPSFTTVAVKMLKEGATASEHKALMSELQILSHIGPHLNVVNVLGACTKPGGPLMVIVEYCKFGNLSAYLKSKRDLFLFHRVSPQASREEEEGGIDGGKDRLVRVPSGQSRASSGFSEERGELSEEEEEEEESDCAAETSSHLHLEDLISYSYQVARGMDFLSSRKQENESEKNSLAMMMEILLNKAIISRDLQLYSLMCACWEGQPEDRPTFPILVEILGDLLQTCVLQDGKDYIPVDGFISAHLYLDTCQKALMNSSYISSGNMKAVSTFQDLHDASRDENPSDSGMVLPSEELKGAEGFETKNIFKQVPFVSVAPPGERGSSARVVFSVWSSSSLLESGPPGWSFASVHINAG
ncbi:hypothetical protein DNTS_012277 [Danionella cerebrum]|uniref:receptor protein-tyrosine kinase n=1 Tax=Danionella cerebrum TaxID=2873325 RepID=A0A553PEF9_9TELE|nr:hypothetical protein DNTS_012277 [Danionella translucida]